MKKIGIFYGSTTGTTESVANFIAKSLGLTSDHVRSVNEMTPEMIAEYEVLLFGTSTWGVGELQDDWYDGIEKLKQADLNGKTVALFGCGDADSYSDTFCGGMREIYNTVKDAGANVVDGVDSTGYTFDDSESVIDGKFVGLALDANEDDAKSEERIDNWIKLISSSL